MELRQYQQEAIDSVYKYLREKDSNPCVVLPTGTGKSLVLGKIAGDAVERWNGRVLILAHVKELLEQNADKVRRLCPHINVGIYSAGLNSRDTREPIIVAGIQSVYDKADILGRFDLVIIDEAHLIAPDGDGMYRTFLQDTKIINPHVRLIGLTATPFRLKGGLICKPENLLNEICYEAGLKDMIAQGYLAPLVSKAGRAEADLSNVHIRGGEFVNDELASVMDREDLVKASCNEIVQLTKDRRSVLIFCTSVAHCRHVAEVLSECSGQECAIITGETPAGERCTTIARFRGENVPSDLFGTPYPPLKFLCNVGVLTTGFDAPNTDCVVLLRPTQSPGLLVQMVGRGTRLSPETGKTNCLVLDYGGNIMRHGPIDMIKVKTPVGGNGPPPMKKCPDCHAIVLAACRTCPECSYQFPPPKASALSDHASSEAVLSGEITDTEFNVLSTHYSVHYKRNGDDGAPLTMRVEYSVGIGIYKSEWVCPEHIGYARKKFEKWWQERAVPECPIPKSAKEAVDWAKAGALAKPVKIIVRKVSGDKFERIIGGELAERPEMTDRLMEAIEMSNRDTLPKYVPIIDDDDIPF